MDNYIVLCTGLRGSARGLNGNIGSLQKKAERLQKAIDKVSRGDYKASDLTAAYSAQRSLSGSITRLGEICGAMNSAASYYSEASAELSGRANLTAYYMQHSDTLSYEELMGTYTTAIVSSGSAVAGYELVKSQLSESGYAVGSLGTVSNAVQDAIRLEAEEQARRAEDAKWAKIGLTALVVAGGIAASFVTGGAAAPIIIGAISGAVMAGGNTAIDQYAEHGWDTDNWDYEKIGKDAFIGGVSGAATAWIGGSLSKGVAGLFSQSKVGSTLLNSSNGFVRVGTGAAIGSTSQVVSGVGSRGAGTFISSMIETDGDIGKSFSAAKDSALDPGQMLKDSVLGGIAGGKQQYKEWKEVERQTARTKKIEMLHEQNNPKPSPRPSAVDHKLGEGISIEKDPTSSTYYAAGDHYDEFLEYKSYKGPLAEMNGHNEKVYIRARDIEGVSMGESDLGGKFFQGQGSDGYLQGTANVPEVRAQLMEGKTLDEIAQNPNLKTTVDMYYRTDEPIKVTKVIRNDGGSFYLHEDHGGRHRVLVAQSFADLEIPAEIEKIIKLLWG